jgi:hypothetical protein
MLVTNNGDEIRVTGCFRRHWFSSPAIVTINRHHYLVTAPHG